MQKLILRGSAAYLAREDKLRNNKINYIMLNLPFYCNYHCLKCCNRFRKYKSGVLNLAKIKKVILKIKKHGAKVLVIAGEGEPTLNKYFKEIIRFADKNQLIPYVFSNGNNIDRKFASFLARHKTTLIINMDAFEAKKYNRFVGTKGAFDIIKKNLIAIKKIYRKKIYKRGKQGITMLAINLVLNNENYDQIEKIKKFCKNIAVFVVNEPINIGSAHKSWKIFKNFKKIKLTEDISFPLGTLSPRYQCSYMRNGVSIASDGSVLTCAYALDTQGAYGDIDQDINLATARVQKSVDHFYKKFGKNRCILRHPNYQKFLDQIYERKN
jgi:MoaA/NifB/PqqE/SkfB family radical SAM enzyme